MKISNQTTFTWVNGWSLTITPAWNCVKVSVMGPRQVFYSVANDLTYVSPSADEVFRFMNTKELTQLMAVLESMPANVMLHYERSCEDCHEERLEQLCYDPNQFNSLQS